MLRENPMLKLFLPFAAGVLLRLNCPGCGFAPLWTGLLCLLVAAWFLFFSSALSYGRRWVTGFASSLVLLICGTGVVEIRQRAFLTNHYRYEKQAEDFKARIISYPAERPRSYKVMAEIKLAGDSSDWKSVSGKILLYMEKSDSAGSLKPGEWIVFRAVPQGITNTGNPGSFDYKAYLSRRGVFFQAYLPDVNWLKVKELPKMSIGSVAARARMHMLGILARAGMDGDDYAVASAILLGYSDYLDPALRQAYSGSGAMHVLCVSGLHVGIVYLALSIMLGFLKRLRHGQALRSLIIVLAIWGYAMMTGLSPSVTRAATMFTFVSAGGLTRRRTPIYNTLAASAFFILIFNPGLIAEIGFQLSYLAVLGIVSIQPGLYGLLKFKFYPADKAWALITVSIAAQLATFPLAMFYFNQFPSYFLLTNLLVIPLSFLIMVSGLLYFIVSPFAYLGLLAGRLLGLSIGFMNDAIRFIEDLPGAVVQGIFISQWQMWFIYLGIILLVIFFVLRRNYYFFAALTAFLCVMLLGFKAQVTTSLQGGLYALNAGNTPGFCLLEGQRAYLTVDTLAADREWARSLSFLRIKEKRSLGSRLFSYRGKVFFIDRAEDSIPLRPEIAVDYWLVSGRRSRFLPAEVHPGLVVADAGVPRWMAMKWKEEAAQRGILFHAVAIDGPLIVTFD